MKQSLFEHRHQAQWQQFEQLLERLEHGRAKAEECQSFVQDYRRLCQHLALAEERGYSSYLIDPLQQLALRGHQQLYRQRSAFGANLLSFVLAGFPRLVRQEWRLVLLASLLFFGSLLAIGVLVYLFPDLIYSLVSPQQVSEMQGMYDPTAGRLGRAAERASSEDWVMFGYYIMHNIGIAFQTFASGLLFGVGSVFFLFFNGLMIGAIAGHLTQIGFGQTFWPFVIGHGAFELSAIALSGAAGLKLAWLGLDRAGPPDPRRSPAASRARQRATDLRRHRLLADRRLCRSLLVLHDLAGRLGQIQRRQCPLGPGGGLPDPGRT